MEKGSILDNDQMILILKEQVRMLKEQLQRKDAEVFDKMNERTEILIKIQSTEQSIKMIENPVPAVLTSVKPQFTREWARTYMQWRKKWEQKPAQTKEIVERFYRNESEAEKDKAIKTLSVVFNNLVKSGELSMEKREGIKGNFYSWNGDIE